MTDAAAPPTLGSWELAQEQAATRRPATTDLCYLRLCRTTARGGRLPGGWSPARRRALGRVLAARPDEIEVVPRRSRAVDVAGLAAAHRLATLGAEAVASAQHLDGSLGAGDGDDGPGIGRAVEVEYRAIGR